jgi:hypothetical protein
MEEMRDKTKQKARDKITDTRSLSVIFYLLSERVIIIKIVGL